VGTSNRGTIEEISRKAEELSAGEAEEARGGISVNKASPHLFLTGQPGGVDDVGPLDAGVFSKD
jgi:hypothetical protein